MVEEVGAKAKLEPTKNGDFTELQGYFDDKSVANSRMSFKIRSQMVPKIPGISKTDTRKREQKKRCWFVSIVRRIR